VIVTLALFGVAAAVVAVRLARTLTRRLARYVDAVEGFAAAVSGCPSLASTRDRRGSRASPPSLAAH
jgi:hypothetical protein